MKFAPALCLAALTSAVYAVDPLVLKGTKFFNKNTGDQFFFKGVAYQPQKGADPTNPDPLADTDSCKRDIAIFKELGLNAIRVYDVDSSKNHDACMKALDDAGIYVVLDVPNSDNAINRAQPSWDVDLFNHYKQKIDAFIGYDNLAAFIIGNEVTNDLDTTEASAYVKAAARDIKNYIKTKSRYVPLGYADNDDPTLASNLVPFFNCGDSADARIDFYGINTYRWCGDNSSFKTSGYDVLTNEFKDFSIPVIMTEYGCNKPRPRHFHEIESIYGPDMQDVFSGGFMYEYSEEDNEYGIVKVQVGSSDVKHTGDFESFKNMTAKAKPQGVKMSSVSNSDSKPSQCPAVSENWKVDASTLPPTPNSDACSCMVDSLKCTLDTSSDVDGDAVGKILGYICGGDSSLCAPISGSPTNGTYGIYSACSPNQRTSFVLNASYLAQNGGKDACTFEGLKTKVVKSPTQDPNSCKKKAESALTNSGGSKGSSGSDGDSDLQSSASPLLASLSALSVVAAAVLL